MVMILYMFPYDGGLFKIEMGVSWTICRAVDAFVGLLCTVHSLLNSQNNIMYFMFLDFCYILLKILAN